MKIHTERTFAAAHRLVNYDKSSEWNYKTFGNCHKETHGHNFKVIIDIIGERNIETGMIVNFGRVKEVIDQLDHKNLNELKQFKNIITTAENIAVYLAFEIKSLSPFIKSVKVKVYEAEKSFAEVTI